MLVAAGSPARGEGWFWMRGFSSPSTPRQVGVQGELGHRLHESRGIVSVKPQPTFPPGERVVLH